MNPQAEIIKSAPIETARELAEMLKLIPRDERLRIEGAIRWAIMAPTASDQVSA